METISRFNNAAKRTIKSSIHEDGFWSAFLVILIATLTLMGIGAFTMLKSESPNIVNQVSNLRAEYAMNGGVYYGIRRLTYGPISATPITIGPATVSISTALIAGSPDLNLTVTGTANNASRGAVVRITIDDSIACKAIWTTGTVTNVSGKDSNGVVSTLMRKAPADSMPTILVAALNALSTSQLHDQLGATYSPTNNYPSASFYDSGVTPNVTHVTGNMTVGAVTINGIFVVDGTVTLNSSASRVNGVILLTGANTTTFTGSGVAASSTIFGGIVSRGNITTAGTNVSVSYDPEYMKRFCQYLQYPHYKSTSWTF